MDEQKFAEQVFNGSLAVLAVLIAVAGIISVEYEKPSISGNSDVEPAFRFFLYGIAGLSIWAGFISFLSLARLRQRQIWPWLVVTSVCILLLGTVAVSVGIVVVTIFY